MNSGVITWLIIFTVSAIVFLVTAAVVAVRGFFDLKALLRNTKQRDEFEKDATNRAKRILR